MGRDGWPFEPASRRAGGHEARVAEEHALHRLMQRVEIVDSYADHRGRPVHRALRHRAIDNGCRSRADDRDCCYVIRRAARGAIDRRCSEWPVALVRVHAGVGRIEPRAPRSRAAPARGSRTRRTRPNAIGGVTRRAGPRANVRGVSMGGASRSSMRGVSIPASRPEASGGRRAPSSGPTSSALHAARAATRTQTNEAVLQRIIRQCLWRMVHSGPPSAGRELTRAAPTVARRTPRRHARGKRVNLWLLPRTSWDAQDLPADAACPCRKLIRGLSRLEHSRTGARGTVHRVPLSVRGPIAATARRVQRLISI